MLHIVETPKDVQTAARDFEAAVKRYQFGILHVHHLKQTLKEKGIDFPNACEIFEICNPQQATKVLTANMAVNMALPCRVSIYQEGGKTKMGMIRPTALIAMFPNAQDLKAVAEEVDAQITKMMEEAK